MDVLGSTLAGLVELFRSIVQAIAGLLGIGEAEAAFGAGIVAAVAIGWVLLHWFEWVAHSSDAAHAQAVVHLTHLTPLQVFRQSLGNAFRAAGALVVVMSVLFALMGLAPWKDAIITSAVGLGLLGLGAVMVG